MLGRRSQLVRTARAWALLLSLIVMSSAASAPRAAVPGEVTGVAWCADSKDCLAWAAVAGATGYTLYRGDGPDLGGLLDASPEACTVGAFAGPGTGSMLEHPPAGVLHWYLVTASNADGEGTAGAASAGPRSLESTGACGAVPGGLVLNEVDYDQPSTDGEEFVEIYNAAATARNLGGVALILVNGQNSQEYARIDLDAAGPTLASGAFLVVGAPDVVAALPPGTPSIVFAAATNNLQNGAPDGIALFDTAGETLLDALSYEGSIGDAQFAGVAGTFDLVEGTPTAAADSNSAAGSLARFPDGSDTDDANADWWFNNVPSPGLANPVP